jgi:CheY-like chemotaxis protein
MNRKIVKRVIDGKFGTIEEAENGLEAMKMCSLACREERPYHLILMDSHMPVMNGLDATKSIKGILDNIRIVGVTGNALKHEIDSFLAAGADKVMVKPLNLEELYRYLGDISFGGPSFDDEPLYLSSGSMDQF